ncbi:putative formate transporter 1 [Corynebacterium ciconiae DSM 44920]|uniref:formate/nitrite transporter family protein n=1 Tax=Corynebacterium ciconiae TaxID=227319 RepID=UPI0003716E53|nr:formate/nitrite transporter family protein [Corynebacterium ciconiae]WKD60492.1 putative formate transporter 1 [Corynebacterium ciconiae DSM 44920]
MSSAVAPAPTATPAEVVDATLASGEAKAAKPLVSLIVLGFFAGAAISLGAVGNVILAAPHSDTDSVGLLRFMGSAVFPVGLIAIVLLGMELFTSNTMMAAGPLRRRYSWAAMLRNWGVVYLCNFIGAFAIAAAAIKAGLFDAQMTDFLLTLTEKKAHAGAGTIVVKAILCNVLVCAAVLMATAARHSVGKIFGIWFPIMLFVLLGFEHCVANMFYMPAGLLAGADYGMAGMLHNIVWASVGNLIGGAGLFIGLMLSHTRS